MKILRTKQNKELDKKSLYRLLHSPVTKKISEQRGQTLNITEFCFFHDEENDKDILSLLDKENNVYATDSSTFQKAFIEILDFFEEDEIIPVEVIGGVSKNGREFSTCSYAG